jgi:hypothetical protein
MTDFKTFIDPSGQAKDWLTVQRVEQLKADKENQEEIIKKNPAALLMAGLCAYIRKTALFLASRPLAGQKSAIASGVELELSELKKCLVILSKQDESRNPEYTQQLSNAWHQLLDSVTLVEFLERKKNEPLTQIKTLIETFQSYPPKQPRSLGFYMTKYAGKDWLPFPCMEMLQQLHENFIAHPKDNQLAHWIASIDFILNNLMKK